MSDSRSDVQIFIKMASWIGLLFLHVFVVVDAVGEVRRADDTSVPALEQLVQQQAQTIQTLQGQLSAALNRITSLETDVTTLKGKVNAASTKVAFTVRFKQDNIVLGTQQILAFDDVISNIGNGYNPQNGMFTAPTAGVYAFYLSQMSVNGHAATDLAIVKQGAVLDIVFTEGGQDTYDQGSSQVTTHLASGEQVWVRQHSGDSVRGDWWTIFTGYLVQAD